MRTLPKPTSGRRHILGPEGGTDLTAEVWTDRRGTRVGYKTQGMRKECHKAAWQGRGTEAWTTEAPHPVKSARWATRTKGRPPENTCPPSYAPSGSACPTETQREDAIRLRQPCPPANTPQDA